MKAAVYTFVHSHNVCDTADPELSDQPPFCNSKINAAKDFRKVLIFMHDSVSCANGFWSRKFGLEIDEHTIMVNIIISNERNKALLCASSLHVVLIALPALGRSRPGLINPTVTRMGFEPKAFRPLIRCGNHYATRGRFFVLLFFFFFFSFTVVVVVVAFCCCCFPNILSINAHSKIVVSTKWLFSLENSGFVTLNLD